MNIITSQQYFVAINPALAKYFQSLTVAAIFERAEYWFSKKENQFYKFIEPCNHPCYREGDSWCEELGITRKVFRKAFEMIGIRYISKTQFDQEEDPFKGKFFAYYFDRKSNKTIFIRNNKAVDAFFQETKLKKSSQASVQKEKTPSSETQSVSVSHVAEKQSKIVDLKKGRSCTVPSGQSYVRANKDITNNTSNSSSEDKNTQGVFKNSDLGDQMIRIWKEETEDKLNISQEIVQTLPYALETLFGNSLETWKSYCRKVASSKFLMGEGSNKDFKIRLSWAIQEKTVERVNTNEFGNDRVPPKIQDRKFEINRLLSEKESLQRKADSLRGDLERSFRNKTKEILEKTSLEEREDLERDFTEMLDQTEPTYAVEFRRKGWKAMFSESRFICYVSEKIFGSIEQSSLYLEAMKEIGERLESIQSELGSVWG